MLVGRESELATLAAVVDAARAGRGGLLCLEGEPGAGKTALLEAAVAGAQGMRVLRSTGVESDIGLGHRRVSYLLPSADLGIAASGVFWPSPDDPLAETAARASRHRPVWADIRLPGD